METPSMKLKLRNELRVKSSYTNSGVIYGIVECGVVKKSKEKSVKMRDYPKALNRTK